MRHMVMGLVLLGLLSDGSAASGQGRDARVDPRVVANWLPQEDPWQSWEALPVAAYCRLYVEQGRIGGARRGAWRDEYGRATRDGRSADALPGIVVLDRCVPYYDYLSVYRPWQAAFSLRDVAELERARARLARDAYPLGPHGEDARFGDPYSGRPDPYPEEHRLRGRLDGQPGGTPGAAEASGASQGSRCAVVSVRTTRGSAQRVRMPLPVLGAGSAEALADAIERELDAGRALNIGGLDGMALRISPEDGLRRLIVAGCDR